MSILEIRKFNDKILRKKAEEVGEIDEGIKRLVFDMMETMRSNNGIGLAAPQVGVSKKVIVLQSDLSGRQFLSLINPRIIKKSREKDILQEGCLSFPDIFLDIKRAKEIEAEGLDEKGNNIKFKADGPLARTIQHEVDHLSGILFFNRLGFWERIKFKIKHRYEFNRKSY